MFLVVKDSLEQRGVLNEVKARIRAEVYSAIERPTEGRPVVSNENILINELIREYLEFNKYKYTASVLTAGNDASLLLQILCITVAGTQQSPAARFNTK